VLCQTLSYKKVKAACSHLQSSQCFSFF